MANVTFDEEQTMTQVRTTPKPPRGAAGLIVRLGLAKTVAGANIILLVVALLVLAGALYLFLNTQRPVQPTTTEELERFEDMKNFRP